MAMDDAASPKSAGCCPATTVDQASQTPLIFQFTFTNINPLQSFSIIHQNSPSTTTYSNITEDLSYSVHHSFLSHLLFFCFHCIYKFRSSWLKCINWTFGVVCIDGVRKGRCFWRDHRDSQNIIFLFKCSKKTKKWAVWATIKVIHELNIHMIWSVKAIVRNGFQERHMRGKLQPSPFSRLTTDHDLSQTEKFSDYGSLNPSQLKQHSSPTSVWCSIMKLNGKFDHSRRKKCIMIFLRKLWTSI
jgi:hypothetical protein